MQEAHDLYAHVGLRESGVGLGLVSFGFGSGVCYTVGIISRSAPTERRRGKNPPLALSLPPPHSSALLPPPHSSLLPTPPYLPISPPPSFLPPLFLPLLVPKHTTPTPLSYPGTPLSVMARPRKEGETGGMRTTGHFYACTHTGLPRRQEGGRRM